MKVPGKFRKQALTNCEREQQREGIVAMSLATMGNLLPRDFLDRQPKRWQKSQRKRGALKTLKKMQAKREKLEERTMDNIRRDAARAAGEAPAPKRAAKEVAPVAAAAAAAAPAAKAAAASSSSSTGFDDRLCRSNSCVHCQSGFKNLGCWHKADRVR